MQASPQFVGIDLGTTTTGMAWVRPDGSPEIVPNADGGRLTPSVVYFDPHEDIRLVGEAARDSGDAERTVQLIKRHMDDPDFSVTVGGRQWTAAEISALILAKMQRDGSRMIGPVRDVVLTVPANFNELARRATLAAGRIAGLNVVRLVNEPTAAALYYAHARQLEGRIMVYDLGGGTLDITILEVDRGGIRCLTSEGAGRLGGSDFDERILELMGEAYQHAHGVGLWDSELERRRVLQSGEDLKKMLSKLRLASETVGNSAGGMARIELSREDFEVAVSRLFTRTILLVEQALDSVGLAAADIDHVALVGGGTRMPRVRTMLQEYFGKEPVNCGNVDECVALGAALFAKKGADVQEVCNHSYGTLALVEDAATGKQTYANTVVIPKNTPIPCEKSQTYVTSEDNEESIDVEITQGEDTDPRYVDVVGRISLKVPRNRPAGCEVTVTYRYDENQRVHAQVLDERSGKVTEVAVTYEGVGVLTDEQIEKRREQFAGMRIE
ncbi:MAG: Hsp70 family protein [Verrucomicrobiota bacterium]